MADAENKIAVEFNLECDKVDFDMSKLEAMIGSVCQRFSCSQVTVSIAILDGKAISRVNSKFLGSENATDVISFDVSGASDKYFDLAVNAEMAAAQAKIRGHKAEAELALYVLHGLLHNFGFDDADARRAEKMHKTEDEILQKSGYGVVYSR